MTLRQQQTLATAVRVEGFGYWSGRDVGVEFHPAPPDTGIVFVRVDLPQAPRIPVQVANRIEVPRRTNLGCQGVSVEMVEHLLAALAGMQIDNCELRVDAAEMPGCDGSCQPFVDAILNAGIESQPALRRKLVVQQPVRVGNAGCWVEARPSHRDQLTIRYELNYEEQPAIGRQSIELTIEPKTFLDQLADARTFILEHEADWLRQQGLGTRVTTRDLLVYGSQGPLDNPLRYDDECVRHKALDLVGDLALSGLDIAGQVVAYRSGHRLNAELVQVLLAQETSRTLQPATLERRTA